MTAGQRIKAARKKAGLTQKELGEKLGITYQTLAQWENDLRNPKYDTLQRIAAALDVPVPELMGLEQIDQYTSGKEARPEVYRKIEENYQRHHGAQARANKAMEQMNEEGRSKVADYAEDILPRYQASQALSSPQVGTDTVPLQDGSEKPQKDE